MNKMDKMNKWTKGRNKNKIKLKKKKENIKKYIFLNNI